MFVSVRQCAEQMTQLPRLKVTGQGQGIYPEFCVCSISPEPLGQFSLNFTQKIPTNETMSRAFDPSTYTQGQCHRSRSCDLPINLCPLRIS